MSDSVESPALNLDLQLQLTRRKCTELEHARKTLAARCAALEKELQRSRAGAGAGAAALDGSARAEGDSRKPSKTASSAIAKHVWRIREAVEVLHLELDSLQEQPDVLYHARRVLRRVNEFGTRRAELHGQLLEAHDKLVLEFEARLDKLNKNYYACDEPYCDAVSVLRSRLLSLFRGLIVKIVAPDQLLVNERLIAFLIARDSQRRGATHARPSPRAAQSSQQPQQSESQQRLSASSQPVPIGNVPATASGSGTDGLDGAIASPMSSPILNGTGRSLPGTPFLLSTSPATPPVRFSLRSVPGSSEDAGASVRHALSKKDAKRLRLARKRLAPMFPSMPLERIVRALEETGDAVDQAMLVLMEYESPHWVASSPAASVDENLSDDPGLDGGGDEDESNGDDDHGNGGSDRAMVAHMAAPSSSYAYGGTEHKQGRLAPASASAPLHPRHRPQEQQQQQQQQQQQYERLGSVWDEVPRVLAVIEDVRDDFGVEARLVCDRNGMPLEEGEAPVHIIPAQSLMSDLDMCIVGTVGTDPHLLSPQTVHNVVPVVTFRPLLGSESFEIINIKPEIPLHEYVFDYDPVAQEIESIAHMEDGPIRFTSYNPDEVLRQAES